MHRFYTFFLQITQQLQSSFVMKAGLLVILMSGFIIYLTILYRHKKNRVFEERKLLEGRFNEALLSSRVEVQEATFTSVGKELHDNVGQLLSTALMLINMTARNLAEVPVTLSSAGEALDKSILELRSLSKTLNREWLEQFELYSNLQTEIGRLNNIEALSIRLDEMDEHLPLTPEQQFLLFRLLQEGMQNVVRHAGATVLQIKVTRNGQHVLAEMKDNGHGFNTKLVTTGLGIANMRQRAQSLGGSIKWESGENGTLISILIPLKITYGI